MKFRPLTFAAVLFFLLVNTHYFWTRLLPGSWDFLLFLGLVCCFFILGIIGLVQLWCLFQEKFENRQRLFDTGLLALVLALTYVSPVGIIDFEKFEEPDILTARWEGTMNVQTIKIKSDYRFVALSSSFGIDEFPGQCQFRGDTILFTFDKLPPGQEKRTMGILRKTGSGYMLDYYRNLETRKPASYRVTKYALE